MARKRIRYIFRENPLLFIFNPHQKFWIMDIYDRLGAFRFLYYPLIYFDTFFLWLDCIFSRINSLGVARIFGQVEGEKIIFLDVGTHREAQEIEFFQAEFGESNQIKYIAVEADKVHELALSKKYGHLGESITFHYCAVVGPEHKSETVKFYRAGGGSSLYIERNMEGEIVVPCTHLSKVIRADCKHDRLGHDIFLLRMNCEGAEWPVLRDLEEAGFLKYISGYFGMWDDLWKIDIKQDAAFQAYLKARNIRNFTFNDRDMSFYLRRKAIKYHLTTRMLAHVRKRGSDKVLNALC